MENRKEFMQTADDRLMATDVSLEPNQTMIDKGESAHGRLLPTTCRVLLDAPH
jgi:hypothetical protein